MQTGKRFFFSVGAIAFVCRPTWPDDFCPSNGSSLDGCSPKGRWVENVERRSRVAAGIDSNKKGGSTVFFGGWGPGGR